MSHSVNVQPPHSSESAGKSLAISDLDEHPHSEKLAWFYRYLPGFFGNQTTIPLATFVTIHTPIFSKYLFQLFDVDRNHLLSVEELIGGFRKMTVASKHMLELKELSRILFAYTNKDRELNRRRFTRMLQNNEFQSIFFALFKRSATDYNIATCDFYQGLENLAKMSVDEKYLFWMRNMLQQVVPTKSTVNVNDFKKILQTRHDFIATRLFHSLANGEDHISLAELMDILEDVFMGTCERKLKFLFTVYDLDGDGTISKKELELILKSCMEECTVSFSQLTLNSLTDVMWDTIMEHSHRHNRHASNETIDFEDFKLGLQDFPELVNSLSISSLIRGRPNKATAKSNKAKEKKNDKNERCWNRFTNYCHNNVSLLVCIAILIILNIIIGLEAGSRYWNTNNGWVVVARICGQLLNFNSAIVLLFVCRYFLTMLRASWFTHYLPIDQALMFHKRIAIFIVILSIIHVIMHIINFSQLAQIPGNFSAFEYFLTTKPGIGWVGGSASITGWILCIVLLIICLLALPIVRQKGAFQAFYWTHHLFIAYEIILILHGPNFWKWILAPGIIYIIDRILRLSFVNKLRFGKTIVRKATLCSSKVVQLDISRQRLFYFKAGDYVYLNIPEVATYEWHPFTISSPPERTDSFTVHIRAVGNWTNRLYELVKQRHESKPKTTSGSDSTGLDNFGFENSETHIKRMLRSQIHTNDDGRIASNTFQQKTSDVKFEGDTSVNHGHSHEHHHRTKSHMQVLTDGILRTVHVQGPFGSASGSIFHAQHAVLVCTGIGVTPFASILQSIFHHMMSHLFMCPNCGTTGVKEHEHTRALERLDFFWINRTHNAFEWFIDILKDLEDAKLLYNQSIGEAEALLGVHLFLTGAPSVSDIKAVALKVALEMAYKKLKKDMLSGLRTRIETGRPNWRAEFEKIAQMNKGKVTIFYCGIPILKRQLKELANQYNFEFREEVF